MAYLDFDDADVDYVRANTAEEGAYARKHNGSDIPFLLRGCDMLAQLLVELADIGWNAPGGDQYLLDEAKRWAQALHDRRGGDLV